MPPTDSASLISDTDLLQIFGFISHEPSNGEARSGVAMGCRRVFDRGMEHGELAAWRAGDAAGKGRIIFLHQHPRRVFFVVCHIGAVHNNPDAIGSLVAVAGVTIPVDEEPAEILKLMTR